MATTKIVLLSDSTNGWFGQAPFLPQSFYERYGRTVRRGYNGSYSAPTWTYDPATDLESLHYAGVGADEIHLYNNGPGGANWDDIDAAALQACVTDLSPDIVIIALGINGGATGIEALVEDVAAAVPSATVVMVSQNPVSSDSGGSTRRDYIQDVASTYGLLFVDAYQAFIDYGDWENDLLADGTHPNDAGKTIYADTVDPALFAAGLLGAEQEASTVAVIDSAELVLRANRYSGSGDWLDESGNGHHAVPSGSPTWDGEKFTFNGSSQFFTVANVDGLTPGAGDFTVVAVAEPAGTGSGRLISKRVGGSPWWDVFYDNAGTFITAGISDTIAVQTVSSLPGSFVNGTRSVVAWRLIRASNATQVIVDGAVTSGDASAIGTVASPTNLTIGSGFSTFFAGDIYGVAIFGTSLSDAEVAQVGVELIASPSQNRMGGTGAIRKPPR